MLHLHRERSGAVGKMILIKTGEGKLRAEAFRSPFYSAAENGRVHLKISKGYLPALLPASRGC